MKLALGLVAVVADLWASSALRHLQPATCALGQWEDGDNMHDRGAGQMFFNLLRVMLRKKTSTDTSTALSPVEVGELYEAPWGKWGWIADQTGQERAEWLNNFKEKVRKQLLQCDYEARAVDGVLDQAWRWFNRQIAIKVKNKKGQLYWLVAEKNILTVDDLRVVLAGTTAPALLRSVIHLLSQWEDAPEDLKKCVKLRVKAAKAARELTDKEIDDWKTDFGEKTVNKVTPQLLARAPPDDACTVGR